MGRPGAGTGGSRSGGSRPGGGSSHRSRPVSGGRPGGGSSRGSRPSGGSPRGGSSRPPSPPPRRTPPPPPRHTPPPPPPPGRRRYYGTTGGYRRSRGGCVGTVVAGIIVAFIVIFVLAQTACGSCLSCLSCKNRNPSGSDRNNSSIPNSYNSQNSQNNSSTSAFSGITVSKNTPAAAFSENCVIDELSWFDDVNKCGQSLKFFYDKLGVQPYVVFRQYDSSLASDLDKQDFAVQWYNDNIDNEDTVLLMYFAEEKSDEDVGYMCAVLGDNASAVYGKLHDLVREGVDEYWSEPLSTDDMITSAFRYASNKLTVK